MLSAPEHITESKKFWDPKPSITSNTSTKRQERTPPALAWLPVFASGRSISSRDSGTFPRVLSAGRDRVRTSHRDLAKARVPLITLDVNNATH